MRSLSMAAVLGASLLAVEARASEASLFEHPDASWWLSGQLNAVTQYHPYFPAAYSGPNSFTNAGEAATSFVGTLDTGVRAARHTEIYFDLESAGGSGLSQALGLAGFTNLDVVRNPTLGAAPYLARFEIRQVLPLGAETQAVERGPQQLAPELPVDRVELRAGKFSTADVFDVNRWGSDSHRQFLNWAVDNDGAYDYAADTRGYTAGAVIELQTRWVGARFGEMLMPRAPNGPVLDGDVRHDHADNLELELRARLGGRAGAVRLLAYENHADMGVYREALDRFRAGTGARPDVDATAAKGRVKHGVGVNLEQELGAHLGLFARAGWNDGKTETFAYTEVDDTLELGLHLDGDAWGRANDGAGLALVTNGLSADHRAYLAAGGLGFLLGDGALDYGRESIAEGFFTRALGAGFFGAADLQAIANPGYNRDRGPVLVGSLRLHVEL